MKFTITLKPASVSAVVAAPWVWPIVFGTSTSLGPDEMNSRTAAPLATRVAAAGSVPIAWSLGTVSLACGVGWVASRRSVRMFDGFLFGLPAHVGHVDARRPTATSSVTVDPFATRAWPRDRC